MSRKYLGDTFDIHGGGMDLIPTHHTNEIAQNVGCCSTAPVKYWVAHKYAYSERTENVEVAWKFISAD